MQKLFEPENNKRGQTGGLNTLITWGIGIGILAFILAFVSGFVADEQSDIQTEHGVDSIPDNVTVEGLNALLELGESMPTVVGAVVLFVVLALLITVAVLARRAA